MSTNTNTATNPDINQEEDEALAAELSSVSGERNFRPFRYTVPTVRFSGRTGKFTEVIIGEGGQLSSKELGDAIDGVILNVRRTVKAFEQGGSNGMSISYFTSEHTLKTDKFTLFQKFGKGKPMGLGQMTLEEAKAKFPNVKFKVNQMLYMLMGDRVVKIAVHGKSLTSLYDYFKEIDPSRHMFDHLTNFSAHQETNPGGLEYYMMDMEEGERVAIKTVAGYVKEVAANLKQSDEAGVARANDQYDQAELAQANGPAYQTEEKGVKQIDIDEEDAPDPDTHGSNEIQTSNAPVSMTAEKLPD